MQEQAKIVHRRRPLGAQDGYRHTHYMTTRLVRQKPRPLPRPTGIVVPAAATSGGCRAIRTESAPARRAWSPWRDPTLPSADSRHMSASPMCLQDGMNAIDTRTCSSVLSMNGLASTPLVGNTSGRGEQMPGQARDGTTSCRSSICVTSRTTTSGSQPSCSPATAPSRRASVTRPSRPATTP